MVPRAAEQGYAQAQNNLAGMYYNAQSVPQSYAEAAKWFRKAAEQRIAISQYMLGVINENGEGVPQNYAEARNWYRTAADQGHAQAQAALAALNERLSAPSAQPVGSVQQTQSGSETTDADVYRVVAVLILVAGLIIYFLPSIIANARHHNNAMAIFALNLLLGWTLLGWVAAIVWALTADIKGAKVMLVYEG
jgi:TPR repeat protein